MQVTVELRYPTVKRQPWRSRLFVFFRLLSMLTPPMDSWASCPSIKLSPWLRLLSKESSRVASSWRTAYRVGVKSVCLKRVFSVSLCRAMRPHAIIWLARVQFQQMEFPVTVCCQSCDYSSLNDAGGYFSRFVYNWLHMIWLIQWHLFCFVLLEMP